MKHVNTFYTTVVKSFDKGEITTLVSSHTSQESANELHSDIVLMSKQNTPTCYIESFTVLECVGVLSQSFPTTIVKTKKRKSSKK